MAKTRAAGQLDRWLDNGDNHQRLLEESGASRQTLWNWRTGAHLPPIAIINWLAKQAGIAQSGWSK